MSVPDSRAAIRKYELSCTGEPVPPQNYGKVHAVLLRDPAQPWAHYQLGQFASTKKATVIEDARDAPRAACGRRVQWVYSTLWDPNQSDTCPDCKGLIAYLAIDPQGYLPHARAEHRRIREQDQLKWQQHHEREAKGAAAQRLIEAVDKSYDDRPPELKNITKRAAQEKPDRTDTA
jgi:hypothetical protein